MPQQRKTGAELLAEVFSDPRIQWTFSQYCISGIVKMCHCKRCHEQRGEPHDEAAEEAARVRSAIEAKRFREEQLDWWRAQELYPVLEEFYEAEIAKGESV